jgi:isopenicillin-N epimerase
MNEAQSAADRFWVLDPEVAYLNHGSFGATPRPVLAHQQALRDELEREPIEFLSRQRQSRIDEARATLATFVGAQPDDLAFVNNATTGVNAVLRSLRFEPGDELLVTDHAYNACRNALDFVAARADATVVVAPIPFPIESPGAVVDALLGRVTSRTRLAMVDHVTSPTALVLPLEEMTSALAARGVEVLVDGAHAPGMVPLDLGTLGDLGVTYYSGNCHKWLCSPKGAGFLWVSRERQASIRPTVISHGANADDPSRSRFHHEFDWVGTADITPWLCVPTAIDAVGAALEGGWDAIRARNHALALEARDLLLEALGLAAAPAPDDMLGSMAAVPLRWPEGVAPGRGADSLDARLFQDHRIEVPIMRWPSPPRRLLRISAQLYNTRADYERLAEALRDLGERGA